MAVIEVANLHKRYGATVAVDEVSFAVDEGEIFGLLGPNGAGKTTTVEAVVGLRVPDAGTIRVLGVDPLVDHAALRERVGVQLQEGALPPKLRAGEALSLYASFYRESDDPARLIEGLGLSDKREAYYRDLSGGQKQRLSIALALIGSPTIAVLDELTTGLDPQARRNTWELVRELRDRGVTILLVTHDMDEAEHLCDRVALVDAGRVAAIGPPARLAEQAVGGKRVRFRPSGVFDESLLTRLPEVKGLERDGDWIVATGEGDLVNAIILTLAAVDVAAHDVSMGNGALEDAFLALTGRGMREDGEEAARPAGEVRRDREHRAFRGWRALFRRRERGATSAPHAAFRHLVANEWRLTVRNPIGLVWGVGFPILLLAIFGSLPATTKPVAQFGGFSFFDVYLPVMIALGLALLAMIGLPIPLTSYRELGVLRRMSTTPVPPSWLLGAQVVVNLALLTLGALLVIGGASLFRAHLMIEVPGLVLSLVLAAASMFALGLWVSAIAKTQRAAGAIGSILFYPLLFFAGVWVPRAEMPSGLRIASDATNLGAAVHAMDVSMLTGQFPPAQPLLVMAAWAIALGWLAVRMFRWE